MQTTISLRPERPGDEEAIGAVTAAAFEGMPYSNQREPELVKLLRRANGMTVSLVAEADGELVGHIALSPVRVNGAECDWLGVGPVSVRPDKQRTGIGSALVRAAMEAAREQGAGGCVLVGNPAFYGRFGFEATPALRLPGVPPELFMALPLGPEIPTGEVSFHPAFDACRE